MPKDTSQFARMTFSELLRYVSLLFGWLPPVLVALPLLVAISRAWALLRKGRTRFAWVGGLTSILALWVLFVGFSLFSCFSQGCARVALATTMLGIVLSGLIALIESLIFTVIFLGMRILHTRRGFAVPRDGDQVPKGGGVDASSPLAPSEKAHVQMHLWPTPSRQQRPGQLARESSPHGSRVDPCC